MPDGRSVAGWPRTSFTRVLKMGASCCFVSCLSTQYGFRSHDLYTLNLGSQHFFLNICPKRTGARRLSSQACSYMWSLYIYRYASLLLPSARLAKSCFDTQCKYKESNYSTLRQSFCRCAMALLSQQQIAAAKRVDASPYLVMMGGCEVMPKLNGKTFVLQFDVKTGEPLGRYVAPPYELVYWQSNGVNRWMLRVVANAGYNILLTSDPFDGWVVDAEAQARQIKFKDQLGRDVPIKFQALQKAKQTEDPATVAPRTPKDASSPEVINLEAQPPCPDSKIAGMVLGALQKQNKSIAGILQKADET